jgi:hypothetical protein
MLNKDAADSRPERVSSDELTFARASRILSYIGNYCR